MSDKNQYREISAGVNDLPLFHKDWWLDQACPSWDAVVVTKGNQVAGAWPFPIEKKIGITVSVNPILTPYLGPHVFFPKDIKEGRKDNFEHEVITELIKKLPPVKVWNASCRPGLKQAGLFKEHHFQASFKQTFLMDLHEDESGILSRLHEDFRRSIRKAEKEISIEDEPDRISMLYEFQGAMFDRKEIRRMYSREKLVKLFEACRQNDACALWVARKEGQVQAILWNMWDHQRAYYLVSGKNPLTRDNHAMTALIWHAIKHNKALGKASFDFEGSMIPGVERFFRNFGGKRELCPVLQKNDSVVWNILKTIKSSVSR